MIEITNFDHYARGIGKLNNKIVFVKGAIPGDIVNIRIIKEKSKYIESIVSNIIKKSDLRIDSPCPYFDKCGGCDLLNLNYVNQIKFKYDKIKNIVNKYLDKNIKINDVVHCNNNFNYRNKVTFQVKEKLGFYNKNSYDIVEIDKCLISDKKINESIKFLKKLNLKCISKIICRTNRNELMIILETNNENLDITTIKDISSSIYIKTNDKYKLVYGDNYITQTIDKFKYLVSPDAFFQVNLDICNKLYSKIKEYVGTEKNVLDLYCGTGSIGIFVSKDNNVLGIEINESAIKNAILNKDLNNVSNINFICGDSGIKTNNIDFKPDVIIVDPPRSGLDKKSIENIFKLNPQEIIYVSCDPMTLVRDLKQLTDKFSIIEITPYDMFPNTYHVECICKLKKLNI